MRFSLVPLFIAVLFAIAPTMVSASPNQTAAEKIAASLGEQFPGYDIEVSYLNGKVRLAGHVGSEEMIRRVLDQVRRVSGVPVSEVENGLRVAPNTSLAMPIGAVQRDPVVSLVPVSVPIANEPARPPVASVPIPIPGRQLSPQAEVLQVSARQAVRQPAPLVQAQPAPVYAHHAGHGHPQMAPQPQPMYVPEGYAPRHQGPMPGQYNRPNLPDYAWPSYACYPNYAEVCYPKQYSPKAWPYIGPFYPYPQAPLGWRQVTLEFHDGWWWLDFDDGSPSGPFSPLFRQPVRYTY